MTLFLFIRIFINKVVMVNILITEEQYRSIEDRLLFENKLNLAKKNWESFSNEQKKMAKNVAETFNPGSSKILNEASWYNLVGDVLGIVDPTGIVDVVNGISYFAQGDHLFGLLSIISAIPIAGDFVAKPVMGALKIGGDATKGLKVAMKAANVGEIGKATEMLTKLSKEPGVVGKFLQSAKSWAPKVASKVEQLPGGVLKGFKKTILDYLKLLENAGVKSTRFQKNVKALLAAPTAKNLKTSIPMLQDFLKNEKVLSGLTKRGPLSQIFLGGAPRLFGNRRMRILMRQTKWWLGFLDYIGLANFVGPEELSKTMSNEDIQKKMAEYNQTNEAKEYAKQDFGDTQFDGQSQSNQQTTSQQQQGSDPLQSFFKDIFTGQVGKAAIAAL